MLLLIGCDRSSAHGAVLAAPAPLELLRALLVYDLPTAREPYVVEPDWDDEEGNEASSGSQADSASNDGPIAHPDPLASVPALLRGESNGDVAQKGASQKTPHAASWNQSLAALPSPASQVCA